MNSRIQLGAALLIFCVVGSAWAQPKPEMEEQPSISAKAPIEKIQDKAKDKLAQEAAAALESAAEIKKVPKKPSGNVPPEIQELLLEYQEFTRENLGYRDDLTRLLRHQYERRRRGVQSRYHSVVDELTSEERKRRSDAIARFEAFVKRYPSNKKYTPDALFRLAELHFEASNDTYISELESYDEKLTNHNDKRDGELPEPEQDYSKTISLFDQLIHEWPNYRNVAGALYLKGYCQLEMGDEKLALAQFLRLVSEHPKSKFVPETWTRIGEYYFDNNKLPEAISAYSHVLEQPDSPYYDKALYKLAWTYYRNDEYESAIARFRELIEFSDEKAKKTGIAGSELREEALQYLAVSIQEEDWNGDGIPDEGSGFDRVIKYVKGDKPYDVELLQKLTDIFFDNAKYPESVASTRLLLKKFPSHSANPELHSRMVTAYERMQQFDKAFAERDRLATDYGDESEWYEANRNDAKAIAAAETLMEDATIQAATYHHTQAQQLKEKAKGGDPQAEDRAIKEYKLAAVAYENYLKRYPSSENAYQLSFFYAECLYYSFRFLEAAEQYGQVRDHKQGTKYRENAGFSAILSYEKEVQDRIERGKVKPKGTLLNKKLQEVARTVAVPDDKNDGKVREIESEDIPGIVDELLTARKSYILKDLNDPDDGSRLPRIIYKTGEVYFQYKHFKKARKWFSLLVQKYPQEKVAEYAAGNIIETYRQANDWEKMAEWAEIVTAAGLGKDISEEIQTLKVGALFKAAERYFVAEKYEAAATEYVRLLKENPGNRFEDAALNNAAVAFEKTRRFESATRMYERLYKDHPKSPYAEGALYRIGVNSERFYNFNKAISSHLELVEKYKKSEKRADSLFRAALLQERNQNYKISAENYERYAELFPGRSDTAETYHRAGIVYGKLHDRRNEMRVNKIFVDRYGNDPKHNKLVIESLARIAELHKAKGRKRATRLAWEQVITEFNRRGMQPGTYEARHPAHAQFELVEIAFRKYESLKLAGRLENQKHIIKVMKRKLKELSRRYVEVLPYKSFDWTLAAFYRLGHIYQIFAEALYDAPIPKSFSIEEEDLYRTTLEDVAVPIEDEAVKRYEQAYQKAREFRVTNVWTKRILSSLNKFKPSEYPLFKEEKRLRAERVMTPPRLIVPIADSEGNK